MLPSSSIPVLANITPQTLHFVAFLYFFILIEMLEQGKVEHTVYMGCTLTKTASSLLFLSPFPLPPHGNVITGDGRAVRASSFVTPETFVESSQGVLGLA